MSMFRLLVSSIQYQMDASALLLEFEEVFAVSVGFLLLLIYLFYVKYPFNKDSEKPEV